MGDRLLGKRRRWCIYYGLLIYHWRLRPSSRAGISSLLGYRYKVRHLVLRDALVTRRVHRRWMNLGYRDIVLFHLRHLRLVLGRVVAGIRHMAG